MYEPGIVEAEQSAGCQRAGERAHYTGRVKSVCMQPTPHCGRNASAGFYRSDISSQHLGAGSAALAGDCEHGWQHADGQMNNAGHVRVVVIQPMAQDAVQKRCVALRKSTRKSNHGTLALSFRQCVRGLREVRSELFFAGGQCTTDCIEHQVPCSQAHGRGHLVKAHAADEA